MGFLTRKPGWAFLFLYQLNFLLAPLTLSMYEYTERNENALVIVPACLFAFYVFGAPFALYLGLSKRRPNAVWLSAIPLVASLGFIVMSGAPLGKLFLGTAMFLTGCVVWITSAVSMRSLYQEASKLEPLKLGCGGEHGEKNREPSFLDKHLERPSNRKYLWTTIGITAVVAAPFVLALGTTVFKSAEYELFTPNQVKLNNALHIAIANNQIERAQQLMQQGAKPEADAITIVLDATERDLTGRREPGPERIELLRTLLAQGVKPDATTSTMPLPIAIEYNYPTTFIRELVKAGQPASGFSGPLGRHRVSPLLAATSANRQDVIELLLREGASPNEEDDLAGDRFGWTGETSVIMEAVNDNNTKALQQFIKAGAKFEFANGYGRTPMVLAAMKQRGECWQVLLDAGAKIDEVKAMAQNPTKRECLNKTMLKQLKI